MSMVRPTFWLTYLEQHTVGLKSPLVDHLPSTFIDPFVLVTGAAAMNEFGLEALEEVGRLGDNGAPSDGR